MYKKFLGNYKKVVLSLMAIGAMQASIAGQETLNVTFSGEIVPACEVIGSTNISVDFGSVPSGDIYSKETSFDLLCTNNTLVKIYPVNQYTHYSGGEETLKFTVFNGWGFTAGVVNLNNGISQTNNPITLHKGARSIFNIQNIPLVIGVQGEGADKMNSTGFVSLGKVLMKAQSFNVSIPMMIEFE